MGSSFPLIGWPPPEDVYWECPYCGPAAYSILRASSASSQHTAGKVDSVRNVVDTRMLKCRECKAEHLTTFYRDGLVRVAGWRDKGWAGSFEFMATDAGGRWRQMKPAVLSSG